MAPAAGNRCTKVALRWRHWLEQHTRLSTGTACVFTLLVLLLLLRRQRRALGVSLRARCVLASLLAAVLHNGGQSSRLAMHVRHKHTSSNWAWVDDALGCFFFLAVFRCAGTGFPGQLWSISSRCSIQNVCLHALHITGESSNFLHRRRLHVFSFLLSSMRALALFGLQPSSMCLLSWSLVSNCVAASKQATYGHVGVLPRHAGDAILANGAEDSSILCLRITACVTLVCAVF